ncbi:MAG: hypothetical protein UV50_C0017G0018 [Parcubacteria group bacterium GW2011_GWB1_42_9]|nr:MAG: hypothetical protein UV50_C0017G0018 [Parcubacteria group bacterium GW2011_GWB1_42_9]
MTVYAAVGKIALIDRIENVILNPIITLLFALAVFYFLWGLMDVVSSGDDSSKRTQGRNHIMWGLVGIFIMVAVYGLMNVAINTIFTVAG